MGHLLPGAPGTLVERSRILLSELGHVIRSRRGQHVRDRGKRGALPEVGWPAVDQASLEQLPEAELGLLAMLIEQIGDVTTVEVAVLMKGQ